jgi:hypothetical protein
MDLQLLPSLFESLTASGSTNETSTQQDFSSDSPDSGKGKEISSESISEAFLSSCHEQQITNSWIHNNNNNCTSIPDDTTTQSISINETVKKATLN